MKSFWSIVIASYFIGSGYFYIRDYGKEELITKENNMAALPTPKKIKNDSKLSAKELQDYMNLNGLSIKEFSSILGVTEQAVKLWVTGQRDFSVTNSKLLRVFIKYPQLLKEF